MSNSGNVLTAGDVQPEQLGISSRAKRRIRQEEANIFETWGSISLETGSNLLFTAAALGSATQGSTIIDAWTSAALVYVPQVWDLSLSYYKRWRLNRAFNSHAASNDNRAYDDVGLALQGAPSYYQEKHTRNILRAAIRDILHLAPRFTLRPFPFDSKNPFSWGPPGSFIYWGYLNYIDTKDVLVRAFKNAAKPDKEEYKFAENKNRQRRQVIHRSKGEERPLEWPANPHRLATILRHIKTDIWLERSKMLANGFGVYGVYHFLKDILPEVEKSISSASQNPSVENMTLASAWVLSAVMGAGAGQHFLQDRPSIHAKLRNSQALAAASHGASIITWDNIEYLREAVEKFKEAGPKADNFELMCNIIELANRIDMDALDPELRGYVDSIFGEATSRDAALEDMPLDRSS